MQNANRFSSYEMPVVRTRCSGKQNIRVKQLRTSLKLSCILQPHGPETGVEHASFVFIGLNKKGN